MSRDTVILNAIDAVAGHMRTGIGKETVAQLTAELRGYFQTPEAESLPVDTQAEDAQPESSPFVGRELPDADAFNEQMSDITQEEDDASGPY